MSSTFKEDSQDSSQMTSTAKMLSKDLVEHGETLSPTRADSDVPDTTTGIIEKDKETNQETSVSLQSVKRRPLGKRDHEQEQSAPPVVLLKKTPQKPRPDEPKPTEISLKPTKNKAGKKVSEPVPELKAFDIQPTMISTDTVKKVVQHAAVTSELPPEKTSLLRPTVPTQEAMDVEYSVQPDEKESVDIIHTLAPAKEHVPHSETTSSIISSTSTQVTPAPDNVVTQVTQDSTKRDKKKASLTTPVRYVPPTFQKKLQSLMSRTGKLVRLHCQFDGQPTPTVTWYKNEAVINPSDRVKIKTETNLSILELSDVSTNDSGLYTCRVVNEAGSATTTANIIVTAKDEKGEAPQFVRPLVPVRASDGESAKLICNVIGKPIPTIAWYQGMRELQPSRDFKPTYDSASGEATLFITEVFPDDEGVYKCKATNKHGTAECEANLIVGDTVVVSRNELIKPPVIVEPVEPQRIDKGEKATFTARLDGYPIPTIKWYCNGREIQPSDNIQVTNQKKESTLTILQCSDDDVGKYEVRAMNEGGEARSSASLRLRQITQDSIEFHPPKFRKALHPQTVPEGEAIFLDVEVESNPESVFTWQQHGVPIQNSQAFQISSQLNRSTLFIPESLAEHAGVYRVKAENLSGSITSTATLVVEKQLQVEDLKMPIVVKELVPLKVMDGEEVNLVCQVHGNPIPRVKWYHNSQPVRDHRGVTMSLSPQGEAVLHFTEVFPEDAGLYECRAVNAAGEVVTSASLHVESYEYIPDSESASITVGQTGTWEDVTGPSGSEDDLLSDKSVVRKKTEKKVKKFQTQESKEDDAIKDSGTAPRFITNLQKSIEVCDGQSARFEVKIDAYPRPVIRWYLNGKEITPSKEFEIDHLEDGTSILSLSEVFPDDAGELMCEAQNENGVSTTTAQLAITEYKDSPMYRKPEWVTRMEEARAKMLGNNISVPRIRVITSDSERSMSLDSVTMHDFLTKCHSLGDISTGSDSVFISECSSRRPSFKANELECSPSPYLIPPDLKGVSSASIFAQSVLSGYLQSHRQSINDALEAISCPIDDSPDKTPVQSEDEYFDTLTDDMDEDDEDDEHSITPVNEEEVECNPPRLEVPRHLNFSTMLSPIQENGETPTSDSGTIEPTSTKFHLESSSAKNSNPDLMSASSMEELKEFLMLETLCTSYH